MLTKEGCAGRVERLRGLLAEADLDGCLISDARDLLWLFGLPLPGADDFPALGVVTADGSARLLCHDGSEPLLPMRVDPYPWHVGYTRNLDNGLALAALAARVLPSRRLAAVGFQAESLPHWLAVELSAALRPDTWYALDLDLLALQRAKDPDELDCLRASIGSSLAAYTAAERVIAAGVNELEVLAAGQRAALLAAGEFVFHNGDYQAASLGGPARNRTCEAGELYIVDAWSVVGGYWSDLCRTYAVGPPSDLQRSVYAHLVGILEEVPGRLKPGVRGTELWAWMDARIREHPHLADAGLIHHAGHGVGLRAHTAPDLNRDREGVLQEGDVVSVEPGAYTDALRAGVRVENTFLITADGCMLLSEHPLTLTP
ncbi:MAG: aminopeptidase P family protein [Armatimonadetes bacterium]|nr:aminopeptidase P family protein [Armatimonadota bacterium]